MAHMTIREVNGLADAILALKFTRRTYNMDADISVRRMVHDCTQRNGKVVAPVVPIDPPWKHEAYDKLLEELKKVAKYGAGVEMSDSLDAGHETILRFIDFTVVVTGLHYGGMADLDSHAHRFENRIVRSSTRIAPSEKAFFDQNSISQWYTDKIIPFAQFLKTNTRFYDELPDQIMDKDNIIYNKTEFGYVRGGAGASQDVMRGLYPLAQPQDCILKINLHNARHVYMRRNQYTKANPELKQIIEEFADQAEEWIPYVGELVRKDWADGQLTHVMNIRKTMKTEDPFNG